jgi:hypothetical protein
MKNYIVKPYVDELAARVMPAPPAPAPVTRLPQPAEFDQDAGSGYNTNHTDPQT